MHLNGIQSSASLSETEILYTEYSMYVCGLFVENNSQNHEEKQTIRFDS